MLKATRQSSPNDPPIEVVPYNPQWPEQFSQEANHIRSALGVNCVTLHHIGSTSVPGLAAKPTIDMVGVVKDILKVDADALEKLGYINRGEMGMLFRRFFIKGESQRTHHLHIWEEGNPEIEKHLIFRNYLIKHPSEAKRYENLKLSLAEVYSNDRSSYTFSKEDLIRELYQKAGFQGLTMLQALTDREWEAVKTLRQKYFFEPHELQDPYTWTFEEKAHFHIVLKKGNDVIGYAHLQFWPQARAALRIIVIDEAFRNQGISHQFLKLLERWLAHQGIKSIHTRSSPVALNFYSQAEYTPIPFNDPDDYESDPTDIDVGKVLPFL